MNMKIMSRSYYFLTCFLFFVKITASETDEDSNKPHSRQKRLIWVTDDGRLALPPGTTLIIAPTLSMPLVRYPPDGFHSNISVSVPLTIDFDKLGLTDNQNPLGTLGILARSMSRSMSSTAGEVLADYVYKYLKHRRKREISNDIDMEAPKLPFEHAFHGGERAILYSVVEDFLSNFGLDGRACVLRTICEIHSIQSVNRFGLFGEFIKLFFTASLSPYSEHLEEYVEAEKTGKEVNECLRYIKSCPKSLFKSSTITSSMTIEKSGQNM